MLFFLILLFAGVILMALRFVQLRRALLRARAGEAQFRQLAEHSLDALWLLDCATLELRYVSPAGQRLSGHDLPALQQHAARLAADLPARLQRWRDGDTSRLSLLREVELPHRDGQMLALEVSSTFVLDAAGQPVSLVGVARDVTQVQAQEAEREKEQQRFASMLSHEFRTPLATIDGAIQRLVATAAAAGADEGTRKRYVKIQTAVDRLLAMINDYLSPERMAAIGREKTANGIAPLALLQQAAATVPASHPVQLQLDEDLPPHLRCDVPGMSLCLKILLDNAVKFSPAGSPIVLAARLAPEGGVALCVSDQGPGVPDDEMGRVFEKGFRGIHAGDHAGAGLGLYMARAVVEVHGGSLQLQNRPEGGAVFRIWLPIPVETGKSLASTVVNHDNSLT
ncbi:MULTISPECIES: HAMP domain-containing sensor histidine kinase [unclassified Janthinobacterium]|uniref:PAS domain-containing sensor histidine kinase n=1 Tax=unclassified Janthinobacterium TaxID=2610881 RepID=UPI00161BA661|nr:MULTISPECIES: HAMP domain-containing sensor histidine kinase [unclassified Janthinobacterium]MBB5608231.1 PAS domain S-box-containing protein [Janthinobacterium sp. S3T4]MBB5613557.1 PAS domain S-box-containing protein [Janthinobacterium sp. S3M3]